MILITSPSKTQHFNGRPYPEYSLPEFLDKSQQLIDQLKGLEKTELAQLMKTSDRLSESTYQRIHSFTRDLSPVKAGQAIFTFQGDAYSAITAEEYDDKQLRHAQDHLIILSGLYGMLRPLDLMLPYRLEMACPLAAGSASNLYRFWQESVTESLNQVLEKSSDRRLVNLASQEYAKVVDKRGLRGEQVTIVFKQPGKKGYRTVPIYAKKARGMMIHFAISEKLAEAEDLKRFKADGYSFSRQDSTADSWCFYQR